MGLPGPAPSCPPTALGPALRGLPRCSASVSRRACLGSSVRLLTKGRLCLSPGAPAATGPPSAWLLHLIFFSGPTSGADSAIILLVPILLQPHPSRVSLNCLQERSSGGDRQTLGAAGPRRQAPPGRRCRAEQSTRAWVPGPGRCVPGRAWQSVLPASLHSLFASERPSPSRPRSLPGPGLTVWWPLVLPGPSPPPRHCRAWWAHPEGPCAALGVPTSVRSLMCAAPCTQSGV